MTQAGKRKGAVHQSGDIGMSLAGIFVQRGTHRHMALDQGLYIDSVARTQQRIIGPHIKFDFFAACFGYCPVHVLALGKFFSGFGGFFKCPYDFVVTRATA